VVLVALTVEVPFGEVGGQQRCRVGAERDVTGLAALAGQRGDRGVIEAKVADAQVGEFLDPGMFSGGQLAFGTPTGEFPLCS
jgi:hypothetical protein